MATYTWNTDSSGLWGTGSDWTPVGGTGTPPPGPGDTAIIEQSGTDYIVSILSGASFGVASVAVASINSTLAVAGTLNATSSFDVTDGLVSLANAGTVIANLVTIDSSGTTTTGTILVSGANSLFESTGTLLDGNTADGLLEALNGGTIWENPSSSAGIFVGNNAGSNGTLIVSGTDASSGQSALLYYGSKAKGLAIGQNGNGTLEVGSGGTIDLFGTGGLALANGTTGSTGFASVIGPNALIQIGTTAGSTAGGITVGAFGSGTLEIEGGGTIEMYGTGGIAAGQSAAAADGLIIVSGAGSLLNEGTAGNGAGIGQFGTGTLQVLAGGAVTIAGIGANAGLGIGTEAGGVGTVTVSGANSTLSMLGADGSITVGGAGTGFLTIDQGGTVSASAVVSIANTSTASGTVLVENGSTLSSAGGFNIGNGGNATLTVETNGLVINTGTGVSATSHIGTTNGGTGTVIINGGTLSNTTAGFFVGNGAGTGLVLLQAGSLITGNSATNQFTDISGTGTAQIVVSGGTWTSNGSIIVGDRGTGLLNIDGGVVNAGTNSINIGIQPTSTSNGTIAISSGTLIAGNVVLGSASASNGTLSVTGGLVELTSLSDGATGTITVNGGSLTTNNLGISSGAALSVGSGGVMTITGTTGLLLGTTSVNVNGGALNANAFQIGQGGTGTLSVLSGGVVTNTGTGNVSVGGFSPGNSGSLVINNGTVSDLGDSINVGNTSVNGSLLLEGASALLITGGTTAFADINATGGSVAVAMVQGGTWISDGQLIVGDSGSGTLAINGGVVNAGTNNLSIANFSTSTGTASVVNGTLIAGTLDLANPIGATGLLTVGVGGVVQVTSANVGSGGVITLAGGLFDPLASVSLNGGRVSGFGTMQANVSDNGSIEATGGTLEVTGSITGPGSLEIDTTATMKIDGSISNGSPTVIFNTGSNETLIFGTPGSGLSNAINGLGTTDRIEFSFGGATISNATLTGSIIALSLSNSSSYDLTDVGYSGSPTGVTWGTDGTTGDQFIQTVCFARGTRIATPTGEVPVEQLTEGDVVQTADGKAEPIIWIGCGRVLVTPGRRSAATPVIVRKGALAENVPNHDLRVTKGHSLFIDDVLIPVEFLVNHRSIYWDDNAREIEIYHVELARHGVLLANAAPAESYRDDGNRWLFHNANAAWHLPPQPACAPVVTGGAVVDAAWRRLLDRAGARPGVPMTAEPDLHLLVDGQRVDSHKQQDGVYAFRIAKRPTSVRVVSRAGVPEELGVARDPRSLGIAVRQIKLWQGVRLRVLEASDPLLAAGFHQFEAANNLRWTDGDAELPAELFSGVGSPHEIELHVACTTQYPLFDALASDAA